MVRTAYAAHLEPFHGWLLRNCYVVALNTLPKRDELLQKLAPGVEPVLRERVCVREARECIGTLRPLLDAMRALFEGSTSRPEEGAVDLECVHTILALAHATTRWKAHTRPWLCAGVHTLGRSRGDAPDAPCPWPCSRGQEHVEFVDQVGVALEDHAHLA